MILFQFYKDYGRMGEIEGLFACTKEDYEKALGLTAYLDEPLGKHSKVEITLHDKDFLALDVPADVVKTLVDAVGSSSISGFNMVEIALDQAEEEE